MALHSIMTWNKSTKTHQESFILVVKHKAHTCCIFFIVKYKILTFDIIKFSNFLGNCGLTWISVSCNDSSRLQELQFKVCVAVWSVVLTSGGVSHILPPERCMIESHIKSHLQDAFPVESLSTKMLLIPSYWDENGLPFKK